MADAEITASVTWASVYVMLVNTTACLCHSFIHTRRTCDSYLNRLLQLNIYRYWSISRFDLSVMTYFWLIHPNLDKYHDIPCIKLQIPLLNYRFCDSVRVFCITEIIRPFASRTRLTGVLGTTGTLKDLVPWRFHFFNTDLVSKYRVFWQH